MRINRQDTNGVKPLLQVGELGYDNYPSGGDIGRVYVGTGSENIPQAKKSEVVTVDGKIDTHIGRGDNPHTVTKTQVGLGSVDNTADSAKNVLSATKLTTARAINGVNFDGTTAITVTANTAQSEIIKFDTGTTEGTDLYTFNGSSAKTINIKAGTNVTLTKSTGSITINANDTSVAIGEVSGLGTGVSTFLSAPTSANLAGMLTDETGTGANVFANSPTLVTPVLGVATGTSFNSITGLSSTFPVVNGVATIGTSTAVAKADHIHPSDTTKVTKVSSTDNAIVRFNGTTGEVQNSSVIIDDDNALINNYAGLSIAPLAGGMTSLYNWLDTSSLYIWAGASQKTGIHINGQTSAGGSKVTIRTSGQDTVVVDNNGNLLLTSGTGAIGYGEGAGGTVTQLTSKSTAVTLNKPSGQITMSNAALAAGASVLFNLSNSLAGFYTDNAKVSVSGGVVNGGNYRVDCAIGSGFIQIYVTNVSGVALSEAIQINFTLLKGAIS